MSIVMTLAPRLAVERIRGSRGGGTLDALAVVAFTVSAFLGLTVAGGTSMFLSRRESPTEQMPAALGLDGDELERFLDNYIVMTVVACALLVIPVLSLGAAAARLGARGRARRLASLRLIGMTGGTVVVMSVVETLVQALVGTALGLVLWMVSLPAWRLVDFHGQSIAPAEMLPPWWVILTVVTVLLALAVASTAVGLRQVRISPLGVATQHTPRALRGWRVAAFVIAVVAFIVFIQSFNPEGLDLRAYALFAAIIFAVIGALNLVGPWVLQTAARPGAWTSSVPRLVAMRRIIDDPRNAWRNVSAVALLGMIAAYFAVLPTESDGQDAASAILMADMRTGAIITLAVGLVVAATSTLVNQAALVVDRAEESVAMDRAGMPRSVFASTRRHHVLAPLVITLAFSVGTGFLLTAPFIPLFGIEAPGLVLVGVTVACGLLLTLAVAEACRPLQRKLLEQPHRRND